MPVRKESQYSKDWFKKGEEDLKAAEIILPTGNLGIASFHIQQALEKYLKGYLLSKNWKLRRIHDLEELLDDAVKLNPSFEKYRSLCQVATEYYIEDRYPFDIRSELENGEIKSILDKAKEFIVEILKNTGVDD